MRCICTVKMRHLKRLNQQTFTRVLFCEKKCEPCGPFTRNGTQGGSPPHFQFCRPGNCREENLPTVAAVSHQLALRFFFPCFDAPESTCFRRRNRKWLGLTWWGKVTTEPEGEEKPICCDSSATIFWSASGSHDCLQLLTLCDAVVATSAKLCKGGRFTVKSVFLLKEKNP